MTSPARHNLQYDKLLRWAFELCSAWHRDLEQIEEAVAKPSTRRYWIPMYADLMDDIRIGHAELVSTDTDSERRAEIEALIEQVANQVSESAVRAGVVVPNDKRPFASASPANG